MDLGRTRGKIKRQRRHSKRENVEKVFWGGNSEEIKKKRQCQNEPTQMFQEKVFSDGKNCERNTKEYFALSKKTKWKQMRNTFFFQKRVCKKEKSNKGKTFKKGKHFLITFCLLKKKSMQKEKKQRKKNQINEKLEKEKRETKEKQSLKKENKKG